MFLVKVDENFCKGCKLCVVNCPWVYSKKKSCVMRWARVRKR